jgi:hypothetical protein
MPKALKRKKVAMPDKKTWLALKACLVLLILIFIFIIIYRPHTSYPYPLHADEWMHANAVASGNILDKEIGFYIFLYPLSKVFNLIQIYPYLPAIWACVSALALFAFMLYLTRNYWISLLSMAFFSALKSNANIMGVWFFVPFVFALPFCYLTLYFLDKGLETRKMKFFIFATLSLFYVITCHGAIGALILAISAISMLARFRELKESKYGAALYLLAPLVASVMLVIVTSPLNEISKTFTGIIMRYIQGIWLGGFTPALSIFRVSSLSAVAAALVGAIFALKNKKQRVLVIWCAVCLIPVLLNMANIHFVVRTQRAFYYLMMGMAPLSAIGLYNIIKFTSEHSKKAIAIIISIILVLVVFINAFYGYYDINYQSESKYTLGLYYCYNPESNNTLQYQLEHSPCFPLNYSSLEPLVMKYNNNMNLENQSFSGKRI